MKKGPIILLAVMVFILVFLGGMNFGKKVEKTDKKYQQILSLTPKKEPTNTIVPLSFETFTHKGCGISFLKPQDLKKTKESTTGATMERSKQSIDFSCEAAITQNPDKKPPTSHVIINNQKIPAFRENGLVLFTLTSPQRKALIRVKIDKALLPLFISSFKFID